MNKAEFTRISGNYSKLRLAIVGDFCLDRYLEIDPARSEISIETGLEVHNVVRVRSQPGGAGTILNNLVALGVSTIYPVGMSGMEGEGYELDQALRATRGVRLEHFVRSESRRTFTYTKPLIMEPGKEPRELNRLDMKNWDPAPLALQQQIQNSIRALATQVDGFILLDQVDVAETGVVTKLALEAVGEVARDHPKMLVVADSRRGLRGFPSVVFKMNAAELQALTGSKDLVELSALKEKAVELARTNQRMVIVTLAERGLIGADPTGLVHHVPALPLRGPIDIVGAGDSVTANLTAALAAGATLHEALEAAAVASSIVIHQLGTTGTANVPQIMELLPGAP